MMTQCAAEAHRKASDLSSQVRKVRSAVNDPGEVLLPGVVGFSWRFRRTGGDDPRRAASVGAVGVGKRLLGADARTLAPTRQRGDSMKNSSTARARAVRVGACLAAASLAFALPGVAAAAEPDPAPHVPAQFEQLD